MSKAAASETERSHPIATSIDAEEYAVLGELMRLTGLDGPGVMRLGLYHLASKHYKIPNLPTHIFECAPRRKAAQS